MTRQGIHGRFRLDRLDRHTRTQYQGPRYSHSLSSQSFEGAPSPVIVTHPSQTSTCATADNVLPAESDKSYQQEFHPTELLFPEEEAPKSNGSENLPTESDLSFTGFASSDEVRRRFEFEPKWSAFWPSQDAIVFPALKQHETPSGTRTSPADRLQWMTWSMSMSVHDTFSFINWNKPRKRVDSDSSSFYFRASGGAQVIHPYRRGHRRGLSAMSVASNAPPVSLYNRSSAGHCIDDSMHGAASRLAWAQYHLNFLVDSLMNRHYWERHIGLRLALSRLRLRRSV
ncbi:hypothetical protein GY45DRAFT_1375975 [Cubamyces sp. BRFM 1775]|nr:hypothetical protein GY45DRAFT_1375975 [Cubamyces sp. BRFM 1775]